MGCVYCEDTSHKATQCDKITETSEQKKILAEGLHFNCAMKKHRASECASKTSSQHCKGRRHSSICEHRDLSTGKTKKLLTNGAANRPRDLPCDRSHRRMRGWGWGGVGLQPPKFLRIYLFGQKVSCHSGNDVTTVC